MMTGKRAATILHAEGKMLIVPMDIKGIRLYLGDPANFRFVAAHEEAATLTEALKVCLAKARLLQPDEMPRSGANEAWPADVRVFAENLRMKPEKLERVLVKIGIMLNEDVITFTYTKRGRGKLAFDGLPPDTQKKVRVDAAVGDIAAAMQPITAVGA